MTKEKDDDLFKKISFKHIYEQYLVTENLKMIQTSLDCIYFSLLYYFL